VARGVRMRRSVGKILRENIGISFDEIVVEFGEILSSFDRIRRRNTVKLSQLFPEFNGLGLVELLKRLDPAEIRLKWYDLVSRFDFWAN
jgi:hypothetical protein